MLRVGVCVGAGGGVWGSVAHMQAEPRVKLHKSANNNPGAQYS